MSILHDFSVFSLIVRFQHEALPGFGTVETSAEPPCKAQLEGKGGLAILITSNDFQSFRAFSCCEYTFHCSNGPNDFQCFSFMMPVFSMNLFFCQEHGQCISFLKVPVYYNIFSKQPGICNPFLAAIACQHNSARFNGRNIIPLASNRQCHQ